MALSVLHITLILTFVVCFNVHASSVLQRKWNDRTIQGQVAMDMLNNQRINCGKREALYTMEQIGMGSNLHQWALALCRTMKHDLSLVTSGDEKWIWEDSSICSDEELMHPLSCYFKDVGCQYSSSLPIVRDFNPHTRKQVPRCSVGTSNNKVKI